MSTQIMHQHAKAALANEQTSPMPVAAKKSSKWSGAPPSVATKTNKYAKAAPAAAAAAAAAPLPRLTTPIDMTAKKPAVDEAKAVEIKDVVELSLQSQEKYKTEMCRGFARAGFCRYGAKCQYAHSEAELRPRLAHKKHKQEMCRSFAATGDCKYGNRCRFIHDAESDQSSMPPNLVLVDDDVLEAAAELVSEASMSSLDASASRGGDDDASASASGADSLVPDMVKAIQTLAIEKASRSGSFSRSRADTSESSEDDSSVSFGAMWASRSPAKSAPYMSAASASAALPRVRAPRKLSLNGSGGSASASASGSDKVEISKAELKELEKMCDLLTNVLHHRPDVVNKSEQIKIKLSNI